MTTTLFLFFLFHVRGTVMDPSARPVEGAKVVCGAETASTNARGEFEIAAAKDCDATVTKAGFAPKNERLTESKDSAITLDLAMASDRVLVTGSGSPVALDEAGVAASVFTMRDFKARQFPFVQDILRDVPGLTVSQTGSNGGVTGLFARGGDSNATLVLLDGVPITEPGGAIDLAHLASSGLDRMEVIRGPESAAFGGEASSAVIQLFTHRGDPEARMPHGSVSYERGSFSTDRWLASIDGGLKQRLDYAFSADQFRTTGEYPNNVYRITTGTANLGYRFSDRTSLRGIYRSFDSYTGSPGQTAYRAYDLGGTETARDSAVSLRLDDARSIQFVEKVTLGYHRYHDAYNDTGAGGPYNIAALFRIVPATPTPFVYLVKLVDPSTKTAPAGTSLATATAFIYPGAGLTTTDRIAAGYDATWTHRNGALSFGYEYQRQAGVISTNDVDRQDNGFFVREQYAITPRILADASARVQHSSSFGTEFTPRGAVTFRLPREVFFRLSASRGIQEPSLLQNFAQEGFYVGNPTLKPATTDSYEAGLSREWFGRRVRTDASFFRNSFRDLIEYNFAVTPGTFVNLNRAWARGVELSGSVRATRMVSVRANYTRLYTRITESKSGDQGQPLQRRPRNSGSVSIEIAPKRWTLAAGAQIVGARPDSDFVFYMANRNPGYQLVYVSASWQAARHIQPFVRIQNALNQEYEEVLGYGALTRNAIGGVRLSW